TSPPNPPLRSGEGGNDTAGSCHRRHINCPPLTPGTDAAGIPATSAESPGGLMFSRIIRLAVLAVAVAAPAALAAPDKGEKADTAKKGPAVLVRVQSVNDLLKTADYVGTLLPEEQRNQLKQGTDFAKALIDEKTGLAGVDVKNP